MQLFSYFKYKSKKLQTSTKKKDPKLLKNPNLGPIEDGYMLILKTQVLAYGDKGRFLP